MGQGLVIDYCGGACPTRAEGFMDGCPFYFRARYGRWDLMVVFPDRDPVMPARDDDVLLRLTGVDETQGRMEDGAVRKILWEAYTALCLLSL